MILDLADSFGPDAVERALPDAASAAGLVRERRPDVIDLIATRRRTLIDHFGDGCGAAIERHERAFLLALARLGVRHGRWGDDFHDYHNEAHALEIFGRRIDAVIARVGIDALPCADWLALDLFAACHDLRQREQVDVAHPIGHNEAASIAETQRILRTCGYDAAREAGEFLALELMIAGSTFDARPDAARRINPAELVVSGGALAPKLPAVLDREYPGWRMHADVERAMRLSLIASDLDTANVGEAFALLAESAMRLAREREYLSGRALDAPESGPPCLSFLTRGQERYFFELHGFCSALGERTFADGKRANAQRVRETSAELRWRFAQRAPRSGLEVLDAFAELAQ